MFKRFTLLHLPKTIAFALVFGVFVPSACIFWFMLEAMENERLAAKQKIHDVYYDQLLNVQSLWSKHWSDKMAILQSFDQSRLASDVFNHIVEANVATSVIVFRPSSSFVYPQKAILPGSVQPNPDIWLKNKQLAFRDNNPQAAIPFFQHLATNHPNIELRARAYQIWSRCLLKLQDRDSVLNILTQKLTHRRFAQSQNEQGELIVANALLQALDLLTGESQWLETRERVKEQLINIINDYSNPALNAVQRLSIMNKLAMEQIGFPTLRAERIANTYMRVEERTFNKQQFSATRIDNLWQIYFEQSQVTGLFTQEFLQQELDSLHSIGQGITIKMISPSDSFIEQNVHESVFIGESMPGWKLGLYFEEPIDLYNADAQIAAYMWIGMLLILSIVIICAWVARHIFRQEKLHNLKNDLMATVTHELKTPLSSIRLFVEILLNEDNQLKEKTKDYLQLIDTENRRLTRLVDNFLTFSRMENAKQLFAFGPVSASDIAQEAIEPFSAKLKAEQFVFEIDIQSELPQIYVDKDMMLVLLGNILENAYKYSADRKYIKFKVFVSKGRVLFEIEDKGIGMSASTCKHIFEGYYRANQQLNQNVDGCGLGLNIAKYIVDSHQGKLSVTSKVGEGSTFYVSIPTYKDISK